MQQRHNGKPDDDRFQEKRQEIHTALFFDDFTAGARFQLTPRDLKETLTDREFADLLISQMESMLSPGQGNIDQLQKATLLYRSLPRGADTVLPLSLHEQAATNALDRLAVGDVSSYSAYNASPFSWRSTPAEEAIAKSARRGLEKRWGELEALTALAVNDGAHAEHALSVMPKVIRDIAYLNALSREPVETFKVDKLCSSLLTVEHPHSDREALRLLRIFRSFDNFAEFHKLAPHVTARLEEALRRGEHVLPILQLAHETVEIPHATILKAVQVWGAVHWKRDHNAAARFVKEVVRSDVFSEEELLRCFDGGLRRPLKRELTLFRDALKEETEGRLSSVLESAKFPHAISYPLPRNILSHSPIEVLPGVDSPLAREAKRLFQSSHRRLLLHMEEKRAVTGADFIELPVTAMTLKGELTAEGRHGCEGAKTEGRELDELKRGKPSVKAASLVVTGRDGRVTEFTPSDMIATMKELELLSTQLYASSFRFGNGKEKLLALMEERYTHLLSVAAVFDDVLRLFERSELRTFNEINRERYPGYKTAVFMGETREGWFVFTVPMRAPGDEGHPYTARRAFDELRGIVDDAKVASY